MITELSGKKVSPIGIGTWGTGGWMFSDKRNDAQEIGALKFALDSGINAIDTAEIYGRGHAEELVCEAIRGRDREALHITSKVWPTHLNSKGIHKAVDASLKRIGTKYLDLYLIHWPNPIASMKEAISTLESLVDDGRIRSFGISNFSVKDTQKAMDCAKRYKVEANQIEYSVLSKGPEDDIIPFCEKNKIKIIAYTPLAKGRVAESAQIIDVAKNYKKTPVQVALNYLMKRSMPIPKASSREHLKEILGCTGWELKEKDYELLRGI
ncbi:MAG: aldo/keto reductase [Candidatus Micrarchaeota archaeon]|nr:aldo/keto reductase [Candidatus Micrarchaeota archaeon]